MNCIVANICRGLALLLPLVASVHAQNSTAITYQGQLHENGQPKSGTVDLRFDAFSEVDNTNGNGPINALPVILDGVLLQAGTFTVQVDFGSAVFTGGDVFFEIGVREDAVGDSTTTTGFTSLQPRQQVTATPYALHAGSVASGAINSSSLAGDVVSGVHVVDGSLNAVDIDTLDSNLGLQRRVAGECAERAAIRAILSDGSLRCAYFDLPAPIAPLRLDETDDVGEFASVATSGTLGGIAYYDRTESRLKYQACHVGACPAGPPVVIDDPLGVDVGQFASLVFDGDKPRIAYYDATSGDLKLVRCGNPGCTGPTDILVLDSSDDVGRFASLAITNDGGALLAAYYDASNDRYKILRCDANCTAPTVIALGGGNGIGGSAIALDFGTQIRPTILTIGVGGQLQLQQCSSVSCSNPGTPRPIAISVQPPIALVSGSRSSASRGVLPWIGFADAGGVQRFVHCLDLTCTQVLPVSSSAASNLSGAGLALALKLERRPLAISVAPDGSVQAIDFLQSDVTAPANLLSAAGAATAFVDLAHYSDGQAAVVYHDEANGDLVYQRCARADCSDQ